MTLAEFLVAVSVTLLVSAATLTVALSSRRLYEVDQNRTMINQNLRAGMDMLGIDVRQAGERLPEDTPAIEILNGDSGGPDELLLRRNLIDYVLPLCRSVLEGSKDDAIFVARPKIFGKIPPGCAPVPDDNSDGWPDNLEAWREYRLANGGEVLVYIYNPVREAGEFLFYDAEDAATFHIHRANEEPWSNTYRVDEGSRLYILEQRRFRLRGDILQCVINEEEETALNLVNHIEDFQASALMQDGTELTALGAGDPWTELEAIELAMVGRAEFRNRDMSRVLVTRFFPRNILSSD